MAPWCWRRSSPPHDGRVAVIDFMPINRGNSSLIRLVEGRAGKVEMCMHLKLRFDYGSSVPWVAKLKTIAASVL